MCLFVISPRWTWSEMRAYGFGLGFRVRACVRVCASANINSDRFYLYLAKRQHMMVIHVPLTSFCDLIKDGRLAAILVAHAYG